MVRSIQCSIFLVFLFLLTSLHLLAERSLTDSHTEVAMRMIGHRVLLLSGDTTSRILPIAHENDKFRIRFEEEFKFYPDSLVLTINDVINDSHIANGFIVEVLSCDSQRVVFSFEVFNSRDSDIIPCKGRDYEKGCYELLISLMDEDAFGFNVDEQNVPLEKPRSTKIIFYAVFPLSLLVLGSIVYFRRKNDQDQESQMIGNTTFDEKHLLITFKGEKTELTGKEADLLKVLHKNLNETVEKDEILNLVWGDEGDYVGRTLDVFISKLRKKLSPDERLKIVNIRGVGYRLVVDE